MLVSRKCFLEINGFDEKLKTSEDYDLCLRLRSKGYKIISDPKVSSVHLNPPRTLFEFYKKEKWHGQEMWSVFLKEKRKVSRSLVYATVCLFFEVAILGGIGIGLVTGKYQLLILLVLVFLFIPMVLAIKTTYHSERYRYVIPMSFIYLVYGVARSASLIKNTKLNDPKNGLEY